MSQAPGTNYKRPFDLGIGIGSLIDKNEARHQVQCICGHRIYDGNVIRARVVDPHNGTAKCKCKRWVKVPISFRQ